MEKFFTFIYDYFEKHRPALFVSFVVSLLLVGALASKLKLDEDINSDFTRIFLFSGILVFSVLLLTYGRIELTLISYIPMFITFIWILGIMGIAGIKFNFINIIISALIFGLGGGYSFFIMDGLLKKYKRVGKNPSSYPSSIILSAISILAGLEVFIFARHPALRSIALISFIGMLCAGLMAQILIPLLFSALIRGRISKKRYPWTFSGLLKSIFAFAYFVGGSLLLTILGWLLVKLNLFQKEKGKLAYHSILSTFARSLIYVMVNVKKEIINPNGENFSKPAVIICNHQSFLDILVTVMLHPKLILLTNNWVWNSPVFGAVVKIADYYPVIAEGPHNSIELLAGRVRQGYSIVVFPEGTRSADGTMKRFHKGAFFLAEKLGLDLLPLMIHGTGYTMTKNEFLLKDGRITLKFLPRIEAGDERFGKSYSERTKQTGRYFRQEFNRFRTEIEQTNYFREQLIYNYLYKGPVLEWYLKIKLRLERNYQLFHELLPREGKLLDIGCGFGFMAYMLQFTAPGRQITGIDYDEEKIAVALHCFSRNEKINFLATDVTEHAFGQYDGIVLADVLHYLQPDDQKRVVENCIKYLNPGGRIVIREGNMDLENRHKGTRATEYFSTRLFRFNKTRQEGLSFVSGDLFQSISRQQKMECRVIDNTKFTSNVIFIIEHPALAIPLKQRTGEQF